MAITKAAPVAKEVDAIPLETLLANPSLRLRAGQYMQYKGVAYKCTDKTGARSCEPAGKLAAWVCTKAAGCAAAAT